MIRVLAIDGALRHSGWVVLECDDEYKKPKVKDYGVLVIKDKLPLGTCLACIRQELIHLYNKYKPTVIVLEDTYAGRSAKVSARLNNAKGVFCSTAFELLGKEPTYISAITARSCLGFKNEKEAPFEHFMSKYKLSSAIVLECCEYGSQAETKAFCKKYKKEHHFDKGNDISDAFVLGFWYITDMVGQCQEAKPKTRKKANNAKSKKRSKTVAQ